MDPHPPSSPGYSPSPSPSPSLSRPVNDFPDDLELTYDELKEKVYELNNRLFHYISDQDTLIEQVEESRGLAETYQEKAIRLKEVIKEQRGMIKKLEKSLSDERGDVDELLSSINALQTKLEIEQATNESNKKLINRLEEKVRQYTLEASMATQDSEGLELYKNTPNAGEHKEIARPTNRKRSRAKANEAAAKYRASHRSILSEKERLRRLRKQTKQNRDE
ncbi:hypothetical protein VNI00_011730 [Paramarasmius palmivorus]|uniref:Uncharacterized protein n=1 Tax=Paramarasmius palmivorus TaxID=297713 RepID=A0AAW0CEG9_9AGAR